MRELACRQQVALIDLDFSQMAVLQTYGHIDVAVMCSAGHSETVFDLHNTQRRALFRIGQRFADGADLFRRIDHNAPTRNICDVCGF